MKPLFQETYKGLSPSKRKQLHLDTYTKTYIKKCNWCGKEFDTYLTNGERNWCYKVNYNSHNCKMFCSYNCLNQHLETKENNYAIERVI